MTIGPNIPTARISRHFLRIDGSRAVVAEVQHKILFELVRPDLRAAGVDGNGLLRRRKGKATHFRSRAMTGSGQFRPYAESWLEDADAFRGKVSNGQ